MQLELAGEEKQKILVEKCLKELKPGEFVKVRARVVRARIRESRDELGYRPKITGLLEDSTSRVFFACYNPRLCLIPGNVVEIEGALVRELPNKNKILLIGERSKIHPLEEKLDKYLFHARISDLNEPLSNIVVTGRISRIFRVLVKKCKICHKPLVEGRCPNRHSEGFYYDLRLSFMLRDDTGAIKCIAPRSLTAELLDIPLSTAYDLIYEGDSQGFSILLTPISDVKVHYYKSEDRVEGYFYEESKGFVAVLEGDKPPVGLEYAGYDYVKDDYVGRALLADLLQFYLDRELPKKFLGFYSLEEYISSPRGIRICSGFSLDIDIDKGLSVNVYPLVKAFESVEDYVRFRRSRGASFKSLKNALVKRRNLVVLSPHGCTGKIIDVLPVKACEYFIEEKEVSLSEYWRSKGIKVKDGEQPLLKVKVYEYGGIELVYPPSQCFFEISNFESPACKYSLWRSRRKSLTMVREALEKLGVFQLEIVDRASGEPALEKLASRLVGSEVSLEGDVLRYGDRVVFLARRLIDLEEG